MVIERPLMAKFPQIISLSNITGFFLYKKQRVDFEENKITLPIESDRFLDIINYKVIVVYILINYLNTNQPI